MFYSVRVKDDGHCNGGGGSHAQESYNEEICSDFPRQSGMDSPSFAGDCRSRLSVIVSLFSRDVTHQFWYAGGRLE
jgi:hypothetical protein